MLVVFTKRKIGILGGMGPEATAELYFRLVRIFQRKFGAKYDSDFPEIWICNLPLPNVIDKWEQKKKIRKILIESIKKLESLGVDFIAVPCNTADYFISRIKGEVSIPILSIPEETIKEIKDLGLKKVGLLGTNITINKNIYAAKGVRIINPSKDQQAILTKIILNILSGKKKSIDRRILLGIIKELKSKGAEKIILGCTELPLLIKKNKYVIDTIDVLAKAIIRESQDILLVPKGRVKLTKENLFKRRKQNKNQREQENDKRNN